MKAWFDKVLGFVDPKWAATMLMMLIGLLASRAEQASHLQKVEDNAKAREDSCMIVIHKLERRVNTLERRGQVRKGRPGQDPAQRGPVAGFFHRLIHPFGG